MRRLGLVLSCALAAAPLVVVASPAAAACTTATRTIGGTIEGEDGRFVGAMMGLDLMRVTSAGTTHIDGRAGSSRFGCGGHSGYGLTIRVNSNLPASGATSGGTRNWTAKIPANVNQIVIEVYPKDAGVYGQTNDVRYGGALRWKVPIPYGKPIHVKLPAACSAGGHNGWIAGYAYKGGVRVKLSRVVAWSTARDNYYQRPILGFKVGVAYDTGMFKIRQLPPGQAYTVIFSYGGRSIQKFGIYVNACKGTPYTIKF